MKWFVAVLLFFFFGGFEGFQAQNETTTPLVMWHGMGDSYCFFLTMGRLIHLVENRIPGIYVRSLKIGNSIIADRLHGFFGNVNDQIDEVCQKLAEDPELQDGYHAIGISQGGQFLRAVAERCPEPPMKNLITLGSQHQGIFGLPVCEPDEFLCEEARRLVSLGAYDSTMQETVVQAQYWHDPLNEEEYLKMSSFLPDINNDKEINESYRDNLKNLENFVMVKFEKDTIVIPVESEWFGFYSPGQDEEVLPLQQTPIYLEDRLGLKEMDEAGKLHFLSVPGNHGFFTDQWFLEEIVDKYLA